MTIFEVFHHSQEIDMDHIKRAVDQILSSQGLDVPDFVWNILEIKNVNNSTINVYYDFLRDFHSVVDGDIVEYGVYRGASLISTALLLKAWGSKKKVYGFDSFSGFPPPHPNDDKARFQELFDRNEITREHFDWVLFKIDCEKLWPREHSFDKTSRDFVNRRIELFGLDNVVIVEGDLSHNTAKLPAKISACLYDSDLYAWRSEE
jgi:Macrocin-O-methyltransferase (TylF)